MPLNCQDSLEKQTNNYEFNRYHRVHFILLKSFVFKFFFFVYKSNWMVCFFFHHFFLLQYYINVCRPLVVQYGLSCKGNSAACRGIVNGTKNPEQEQVIRTYNCFFFLSFFGFVDISSFPNDRNNQQTSWRFFAIYVYVQSMEHCYGIVLFFFFLSLTIDVNRI